MRTRSRSSDASLEFSDPESDECSHAIPLHALPPLPERGAGYWSEPWMGICVVGFLSTLLVSATNSVSMSEQDSSTPPESHDNFVPTLQLCIWIEAAVAVLSLLYLLFGNAGEIRRSQATSYPMPAEVEQRLLANESLAGLSNIDGPEGHIDLGTYCVRCLVWRPRPGRGPFSRHAHHCQTCQRCVTGFDHHCGVFAQISSVAKLEIQIHSISCRAAHRRMVAVVAMCSCQHLSRGSSCLPGKGASDSAELARVLDLRRLSETSEQRLRLSEAGDHRSDLSLPSSRTLFGHRPSGQRRWSARLEPTTRSLPLPAGDAAPLSDDDGHALTRSWLSCSQRIQEDESARECESWPVDRRSRQGSKASRASPRVSARVSLNFDTERFKCEQTRLEAVVRSFVGSAKKGCDCMYIDEATGQSVDATYLVDKWAAQLVVVDREKRVLAKSPVRRVEDVFLEGQGNDMAIRVVCNDGRGETWSFCIVENSREKCEAFVESLMVLAS